MSDRCSTASRSRRWGQDLYKLIDRDRVRGVVVDFVNVEFVSSPALSMLLSLRRKADEIGATVVLCRLRSEIVRLFQITRLEKLFVRFDSTEEALAHFQR